jgi:hypothetical protein
MSSSTGESFGQGKSSGSSSTISPFAMLAATIGKKIEGEVDPLRASFLKLLQQVVTQGGSAVGTPIANQATTASMAAGEQAQQSAATDLARTTGGQANPVVSAILAVLKQQNSETTAAIPTQIGETLLGQVPGAISSAQSGVGNMLGEAIGGYSVNRFNQQNTNYGINHQDTGQFPFFGGSGGGGSNPVFP